MMPSLRRRRTKNAGDDSGQRRTTIPGVKAGEAIRTPDIHVGNVTLYH